MSKQERILFDIAFGYHGEPGQWQDGEHGPWRDNSPYTEELTAAYVNALEAEITRLREYNAAATVLLSNLAAMHMFRDDLDDTPIEDSPTICAWCAAASDMGHDTDCELGNFLALQEQT